MERQTIARLEELRSYARTRAAASRVFLADIETVAQITTDRVGRAHLHEDAEKARRDLAFWEGQALNYGERIANHPSLIQQPLESDGEV